MAYHLVCIDCGATAALSAAEKQWIIGQEEGENSETAQELIVDDLTRMQMFGQ